MLKYSFQYEFTRVLSQIPPCLNLNRSQNADSQDDKKSCLKTKKTFEGIIPTDKNGLMMCSCQEVCSERREGWWTSHHGKQVFLIPSLLTSYDSKPECWKTSFAKVVQATCVLTQTSGLMVMARVCPPFKAPRLSFRISKPQSLRWGRLLCRKGKHFTIHLHVRKTSLSSLVTLGLSDGQSWWTQGMLKSPSSTKQTLLGEKQWLETHIID